MKRFIILFALILLFTVSSFGAEDWIFKVPVKLKNICEDYTSFRVYCIVYIGANYTSSNEVGGGWEDKDQFYGAMDDVWFYSRALSADEVLALHNLPLPSALPAGLALLGAMKLARRRRGAPSRL